MTRIESGVTIPKGLFTLYLTVKKVTANIFLAAIVQYVTVDTSKLNGFEWVLEVSIVTYQFFLLSDSTAWSTMTESVGNETIENTGDFCLVIGTDHALTGFFNLRWH
jgi:hypothetical protein